MKKALRLLAGLILLSALYMLTIRPWFLSWGSTTAETAKTLPGDELVPQPISSATRAITVDRPPAEVWPWIAQIGQGRGGFYSYDWLENLFGCDIHNATRIHPEWQSLKAGDELRLHPKAPPLKVLRLDFGRALIIGSPAEGLEIAKGSPQVTWAFVLEPEGSTSTRLLIRWRASYVPTFTNRLTNQYLLEPIHFTMERKMMLVLKRLIESQPGTASARAAVLSASNHQEDAFVL